MCASHRAVRGLITELTDFGKHTVTDMEAGLEHLKRGTARYVDVMLIVVEPYYRSLEAGSRTQALAEELKVPHVLAVANKVRNEADQQAIDTYCDQHGMTLIGSVPMDDQLVEAERNERAPIDYAPDCPGVSAIAEVANKLLALGVPPKPGGGDTRPTV